MLKSIKYSSLLGRKEEKVANKGKQQPSNVQDVAAYAMELNDRKIRAFWLQKEGCEEQVQALTLQGKAWDRLLAVTSLLPEKWRAALKELHAGLTGKTNGERKFLSGLTMRLEAELEEFSVVQEGIRGQVEQMKAQQALSESRIVQPRVVERKGA